MFSTGIVLLCFDKEYAEATPLEANDEFLEVKIPISLPYTADFHNTSPAEALIQYKGEFYNVVEQRYENDTLITKIKTNQSARERFAALADEINTILAHNQAEKESPLKKAIELCKSLSVKYIQNSELHFGKCESEVLSNIHQVFLYKVSATANYSKAFFTPPELSSSFLIVTKVS